MLINKYSIYDLNGHYQLWNDHYSKKNILIPNVADFGGGKKKSNSEFLSYNLMLNSETNFTFALQKILIF